jgi:putative flippase GtrA
VNRIPLQPFSRFARFVVVGTANTAFSYAVYLLLLQVVDYRWAYTVAYIAGLAGGYWANARFVFDASPAARSAFGYLLSYGVAYFVSLAVLWLAVEWAGLPSSFAMLAALAIAVPLSYVLLRRSFLGPPRPRHGE